MTRHCVVKSIVRKKKKIVLSKVIIMVECVNVECALISKLCTSFKIFQVLVLMVRHSLVAYHTQVI